MDSLGEKQMSGFQRKRDDDIFDFTELMTDDQMTMEAHAAIARKKVEARRMIEDALEAARERRAALDGM